jgi:hypothetical protein
MMATCTRLEGQLAPCGRIVACEVTQSDDLQGLVNLEFQYECGCRSTRDEYHDSSVHHMILHHKGRTLVDETFVGE